MPKLDVQKKLLAAGIRWRTRRYLNYVALHLLPNKTWYYLKFRIASAYLHSLLKKEAGSRFRKVEAGPAASNAVISRTALMKREALGVASERHVFLGSGMLHMADFVRSGCAAGLQLSEVKAAFELGCGGARLIRHLRSVQGLRLVASDLITDNVAWCRENLWGIEFHTNQLEPPLRFANDETFDFTFAFSVFTHIPLNLQLPWIEELSRIMKPGGIATVTVLGPEMAKFQMIDKEYEQFLDTGHYTMMADHPRVSYSSKLIGSWDVFMTQEYVRELYGQALDVVGHARGFQSLVTLRKPLE